MVLSEIGEINRFNHAKKLVAFTGVDPSVFHLGSLQQQLTGSLSAALSN